jgi:hypothetical protein
MTEGHPNRFCRSDLDEVKVDDSAKLKQASVPRQSCDEREKLTTGSEKSDTR